MDILGGDRFINAEPITKGWSEDKKYCVTDIDGKKYLLRILPRGSCAGISATKRHY